MHGRVVPGEKPLLGQQLRPFQPQTPPELAQDIHDIGRIDGGAPRGDVGVDEARKSKKAKTICLLRLACTFAFKGPGLPFKVHSLLILLASGVK